MKKQSLVAKVRRAAKAAGLSWEMTRQGGRHEIWRCGDTQVTIPRHAEINEHTARAIFKDLEAELGNDWW